MWNWSVAKKGIEWLFWRGEVSAIRNPTTFGRHYVLPERVLPAEVLAAPTPERRRRHEGAAPPGRPAATASARRGASPTTTASTSSPRAGCSRSWSPTARSARSTVEGWKQPAFLHPDAVLPRWVRASALLSPFDSLVWERAAHRAALRLPLPHRDLRARPPSGSTATTCSRSSTTAASSPASTSRPTARPDASSSAAPTPSRPGTTTEDLPPLVAAPRGDGRRSSASTDVVRSSDERRPRRSPDVCAATSHSGELRSADVVRTSQPAAVTTSVCSNWAVRRRSTVTAVQPSSQRSCSHAPIVIIGSIVKVMPSSMIRSSRGS